MCCIELLRDLAEKLSPKIEKYIGTPPLDKETELPFLVDYIFVMAGKRGKIVESMRIVKRLVRL